MDSDPLDGNRFLGSILPIHLNPFHLCQCRQTLVAQYMSEYGILAIQMRRLVKTDEELATIGSGAFVRHADYSARVVPQRRSYLVFERLFPYRSAAFGLRGWCAALDHEVGYQSVEGRAIVVTGGAKCEEVLQMIVRTGGWNDLVKAKKYVLMEEDYGNDCVY
jgi:hypothetical protein